MSPEITFMGLVVGILVELTGVGGQTLLTPLLIALDFPSHFSGFLFC
jgi:uncharacterized membrane protein YfcA